MEEPKPKSVTILDAHRKINKKQQPNTTIQKRLGGGSSETEGDTSASEWETEHEDEGTEELVDEAATIDQLISYLQQAEVGGSNSVQGKSRFGHH